MSLYLHLERGEVNERTPTNGQLCALPAKRSGRYGNGPLRYYSATSALVLAFHTKPSGNHHHHPGAGIGAGPAGATANAAGPTTIRLSGPSMTSDDLTWSSSSSSSSASSGPYGFTGTYRFIRKSIQSFLVLFFIC